MSVLTHINRLTTAFVFAVAMIAAQFTAVIPANAAGGTATWTGDADDGLFSTAGNWAEAAIPEDGDELIFNSEAESGSETITNDLSPNVSFSAVTADDTAVSNWGYYYITGSPIMLQDGATLTKVGDNVNVTFNDGLEGAGSLALVDWNMYNDSTITGELSAQDAYGTLGGDNGIKGVTSLVLAGKTGFSVEDNLSFPITVQSGATAELYFYEKCAKYSGYNCTQWKDITRTVSGDLSLGANLSIYVGNNVTAKFTGDKSGTGKVKRLEYSNYNGTLIVGGDKLVNPTTTTKLNGDKTGSDPDAYVSVYDNDTATLDGKRESIYVAGGGTLKGNGTINDSLYVGQGGVLAPGNSPGKITVLDDFTLEVGSTYQAEILDKDSYDQIVAEIVSVDGANLDLDFLKGGKVSKGDKFTLINNTGSDPITGTFNGIDEGDKITLGEAVLAVTYEGGAGSNNFVLTALNDAVAPGTPNTGFKPLTLANPMIVAVMGIAAAAGVLYLRRAIK